jgi:hypothetical protein
MSPSTSTYYTCQLHAKHKLRSLLSWRISSKYIIHESSLWSLQSVAVVIEGHCRLLEPPPGQAKQWRRMMPWAVTPTPPQIARFDVKLQLLTGDIHILLAYRGHNIQGIGVTLNRLQLQNLKPEKNWHTIPGELHFPPALQSSTITPNVHQSKDNKHRAQLTLAEHSCIK